jgi:hypothetical protein
LRSVNSVASALLALARKGTRPESAPAIGTDHILFDGANVLIADVVWHETAKA